jgi:Na+/proline symporter
MSLAVIAVLLGGWMIVGDVQSLLALGYLNIDALPRVLADALLLYFAGKLLKPKAGNVPAVPTIS